MMNSYKANTLALEAMVSSESMTVTNEDYITFQPQYDNHIGIIFYPGCKVEPEAYAPLMRNLAIEGYVSFISKMTQNVSSLSPNEADKIIRKYPSITEWIIIGHSLGGLTACQYAYEHDVISKVILLASYPQKIHNLRIRNIKVLSINATNDGLIRKETIISKASLLPRDTIYVDIQGGNHAQMGSYGDQQGDQRATISPEEQLRQVTKNILEFLNH